MSNEISPLVNLGKINWFGTTHHGVVRNSVLTKPDNSTVSYPQPGHGSVRLVKFPGTPAVPPAAAAVGMLDYALISGAAGYLYGKSVGEWLYKSTSSTVYRVFVLNLQINGNQLLFDVAGFEFGAVTVPPPGSSQIIKVVGASFTHSEVPDIDFITAPKFINASPDGTKSVWRFGDNLPFFIEITLSGEFSASVSILKTVSQSVAVSGTVSSSSISKSQVINPVPSSSGFNVGMPTSDGQTTGASTASMTPYLAADVPEDEEHNTIVIENIVTAFYTRTGALKFVSVEITSTLEETVVINAPTGGGTATWNVPGWTAWDQGGAFWWIEDVLPVSAGVTWNFYSTRNSVYTLSVGLKLDGVVLSSLGAEVHHDFVNDFSTYNYIGVNTSGGSNPAAAPHGSGEVHQVSVPTINENSATLSVIDEVDAAVDSDSTLTMDAHAKAKAVYLAWQANGNTPTLEAVTDEILGGEYNEIIIHRPGNNMACLLYQRKNSSDPAGYYEMVHPEGGDGTTWVGARDHGWGTYHPVTDEIIRNQSEQVCFV